MGGGRKVKTPLPSIFCLRPLIYRMLKTDAECDDATHDMTSVQGLKVIG